MAREIYFMIYRIPGFKKKSGYYAKPNETRT